MDFPKPVDYLKLIIEQGTTPDGSDIILDFFAGSCTTAHATLKLNREDNGDRRFIMVQLPEKLVSTKHVNGTTELNTIADIGKERIRRAAENLKAQAEGRLNLRNGGSKSEDLGFKVYKLEPSTFKVWRTDLIETEDDLKNQIDAFQDPVKKKSEAETMAWEILLKSGYELTTPLERTEIAGVPVYSIANGEVILALEMISQKAIDEVIARKPKRVVCLDSLFAGNDQLKTNTVLQMKDVEVEFKTI